MPSRSIPITTRRWIDNEHVRVLLINYGPGETSTMHFHPAGVSVFITDASISFEMPDGSVMEVEGKAGESLWIPAGHHLPTNTGDAPFTGYHIELKGRRRATRSGPATGEVPAPVTARLPLT